LFTRRRFTHPDWRRGEDEMAYSPMIFAIAYEKKVHSPCRDEGEMAFSPIILGLFMRRRFTHPAWMKVRWLSHPSFLACL